MTITAKLASAHFIQALGLTGKNWWIIGHGTHRFFIEARNADKAKIKYLCTLAGI
jgi:hypothetical protein